MAGFCRCKDPCYCLFELVLITDTVQISTTIRGTISAISAILVRGRLLGYDGVE